MKSDLFIRIRQSTKSSRLIVLYWPELGLRLTSSFRVVSVTEGKRSIIIAAAVFLATSVVIAVCYLWALRLTGERFQWGQDQHGYYNYLGRALAQGQLHLPVEPAPELLELADPWDPSTGSEYKWHDIALFNGRYYLYHGVGPAILLFTPWRLITGHDLPERFALFVLCYGGFLFSSGALLTLLAHANAMPNPLLLAAMLLALGVCQSAPYLMNRVLVYEVAIAGGYFCLSGATFFLAKWFRSSGNAWLAASGLMFGLAVSCRPHLAFAGMIALAGLMVYFARLRGFAAALRSRELFNFAIPFALAGLALAMYNYQRFGNPFEFGLRHLLAGGVGQNRLDLQPRNLGPGLYFMLLCPPDFRPVFPWIQLKFRPPFDSWQLGFPPEYFIEPTVGALWVAPFILGVLFISSAGRSDPRLRTVLRIVLASAAVILLFLMTTHLATQRYEVDFLPLAVLAALASLGIHITRATGIERAALIAGLLVLVAFSAITNLSLAIAGPYNDVLRNRPAGYVRLASMFSPFEGHRPLFNPKLKVDFVAEIQPQRDGFQEPLLTIGEHHYWSLIHIEHHGGAIHLISQADSSTTVCDLGSQFHKPLAFGVTFSPERGELTIAVNGERVLVHPVKTLVTAPSQVTIGERRIEPNDTFPRFIGRIYNVQKRIAAE